MLFFLDIFDWAVTLCIFNFAFFFFNIQLEVHY